MRQRVDHSHDRSHTQLNLATAVGIVLYEAVRQIAPLSAGLGQHFEAPMRRCERDVREFGEEEPLLIRRESDGGAG
jgi:hypothetical protein